MVRVDSPPGSFDQLQQAIDAAADGATITVQGRCVGSVLVLDRADLTIEGIPPVPSGCPAGGLRPQDLTSTVKGDVADVLKVLSSTNIVIRFLNVVDGGQYDGVQFSTSSSGGVSCSCMARNDDGVNIRAGKLHQVTHNLVRRNSGDGIRAHDGAEQNTIEANVVEEGGADGVRLLGSHDDVINGNLIRNNATIGIDLHNADNNQTTANEVVANGGCAITVDSSDYNFIDANTASGSAFNICCESGNHNSGDNVTSKCR